ncbi:AAA-like domain-containing protein [Desulfobacterales bacterium HSG2]|nr:AAA-like domain-containing protein [Desulfobacterales bacterium HSG2]
MRKFSSYGPVDTDLYYHVPRKALIERARTQLLGENPVKTGHYITIWAPRQAGKTWIMNQVLWDLAKDGRFDVLKLELESLKMIEDTDRIASNIAGKIIGYLDLRDITVRNLEEFEGLFKKGILTKPLILILDEFDALTKDAIAGLAGVFRNIHNIRQKDPNPSGEKEYLLHSVALIGVRSVLGIGNMRGSPFNVQRSVHIPNLTAEESEQMFRWYESESGQKIGKEVTDRIFLETRGQPGLTSWLGELLTETYPVERAEPVTMEHFRYVYKRAIQALPNVNIISKANQEPCRDTVLQLFKTDKRIVFKYDNRRLNFLYMNGVIDIEETEDELYVRFSSPFVQKRLFNFFSDELFPETGKLYEPFEDISDTITPDSLNIRNLMRRHETHIKRNREWLLRDAPRRKDLRIYEAVYHFNLYRYLCDFLGTKNTRVYPEFPTGNGKVDLIIEYAGQIYAIEVKSYTNEAGYREGLIQAAEYGEEMTVSEVWLVLFVEYVDEKNREKYERDYLDEDTGVTVKPVFVETGN